MILSSGFPTFKRLEALHHKKINTHHKCEPTLKLRFYICYIRQTDHNNEKNHLTYCFVKLHGFYA